MPTRLNPDTGLFEDVPDNPSTVDTTLGDTKEIPPTVIPDSKIPTPHTEVTLKTSTKMTDKQQLYLDIKTILAEHENLESNIAVNHVYWEMLNKYRSLR